MMKKALAMLSVLTMLTAATGCNGDSSKPTEDSKPAETSAVDGTTAPVKTEPIVTTTTEPEVLEIDPNAITFDTPSLYSGHQMKGGDADEADIKLDIVEYNGDKKMRVQVLREEDAEEYLVPKIVFNLPEMLGVENVGNIGRISVDFTCLAQSLWTNKDGSKSLVVGNFLGALAGNLASEKVYDEEENLIQNSWATHLEFKLEDWENSEHTWRVETKVGNPLAVNGYAANDEGTTLVIMRWSQSNTVDFCIDNITFYDKEGNSMPIIYDAAANPAEIGELNTPAEVPPTEGSSAE